MVSIIRLHLLDVPYQPLHRNGKSNPSLLILRCSLSPRVILWQVTHDITHLTCADFLRAPGVQTPLIVRFSTVIHERGSPETLRDPRGFAVKFYTREGNFDMVGNNLPVSAVSNFGGRHASFEV